MSDVRTGFVRTEDGIPLYWRSIGTGELTLVCCNGVGVSTFFYKYIAAHFHSRFRVLLWDYRGHGRSAPPPEPIEQADLSVERCAKDLELLLAELEITEPTVLLGHSMGCQVILEYAHQHPDKVRALVPMFGTYGRPLDTLLDSKWSKPAFGWLHKIVKRGGRAGARLVLPFYDSPIAFPLGGWTGLLDRHYAGRIDIDKYLEHLAAMDPRVFLRMVSQAAEHSAWDALPSIEAPTLVIASEKDLFTPLRLSLQMAQRLPHAELLVLAEASHAAIVEHPDTINQRIDRFFAERLGLPARSVPGALQAL
jgi:pimeloyl-ACP methyl ester carboxylesterase